MLICKYKYTEAEKRIILQRVITPEREEEAAPAQQAPTQAVTPQNLTPGGHTPEQLQRMQEAAAANAEQASPSPGPQAPDTDGDGIPDHHDDDPLDHAGTLENENKHPWIRSATAPAAVGTGLAVAAAPFAPGGALISLPTAGWMLGGGGLGYLLGKYSRFQSLTPGLGALGGIAAPLVLPSAMPALASAISSLNPAFFLANPMALGAAMGAALGGLTGGALGRVSTTVLGTAAGAGAGALLANSSLSLSGLGMTAGAGLTGTLVGTAGYLAAGGIASKIGHEIDGWIDGTPFKKFQGDTGVSRFVGGMADNVLGVLRIPFSAGNKLHELGGNFGGWSREAGAFNHRTIAKGLAGYVTGPLGGLRNVLTGTHETVGNTTKTAGKWASRGVDEAWALAAGIPLVFLGRSSAHYQDVTVGAPLTRLVETVSPVHWTTKSVSWLSENGSIWDAFKKKGSSSLPKSDGAPDPEPDPTPPPTQAPRPAPTQAPAPTPPPTQAPTPPPQMVTPAGNPQAAPGNQVPTSIAA